jgi:hypothetical protein
MVPVEMNICSHNAKVSFIILTALTCIIIASCHRPGSASLLLKKADNKSEVKSDCDSSHISKVCISPDSLKATAASSSIKEIKGSQPDISKANRSESITVIRPSGFPKGTGKPRGSVKPAKNEKALP